VEEMVGTLIALRLQEAIKKQILVSPLRK